MEETYQEKIKLLCRNFLDIHSEKAELEGRLDQVKEMMGMMKEEIISEFDSIGIKSLDVDGMKLVKYQASHPVVKDFDGLKKHIQEVWNEPLEEYMKESFDSKKLKELTDSLKVESVKQGVALESLLPKGLEVSITSSIQVRQGKNTQT